MSDEIKPTKTLLSAAVALALSGGAASAQNSEPVLEEVIVTATKRAASMQDIPVSMSAMGGDSLRELGIETFDKYVEFLPNVVSAGNGPGKKEIYIRGSATDQTSVTIGPANGTAPGVALYVDEMPISFGARNLDYYAVDLERIEVLAGPQGTIFGASSQSGTMRLITKKPQQGVFAAGFNAKYSVTDGGTDSAAVDGYINVPLTDKLAARAVVYSDNQGGWIDNVEATFTPSGTVVDRNSLGFGPPLTGADSVASAFNASLAEDDWNQASYRGARLAFAYDINDEWDITVQHTAQSLEVDGSFLADPSLGRDLDHSAKFSPERNSDDFGLTKWRLNGRIGNLDLVYAGGFLSRDVDSIIDYTFYNNGGGYITYYLCSGNVYDAADVNNCYDPTKQYLDKNKNKRTTHELRVASPAEDRFRYIAGVYFNDVETNHTGEFQYFSTNDAFSEHISSYYNDNSGDGFLLGNTTVPTAGVNTSGPRSPLTTFFNDFTRSEDEIAFFGQLTFDVSDAITLNVSARSYDLDSALEGASNFSFGCRYGIDPQGFGNSERTADGRCNSNAFSNDVTARLDTLGEYTASSDDNVILDARSPNGARDMFRGGGNNAATLLAIQEGRLNVSDLQRDGSVNESDTIVRTSIDYRPNEDTMVFAAYSEGYRPATQNRNAGQLAANQSGVFSGYVVPAVAVTDTLENIEFGFKGDLLDARLRVNATYYHSKIENLQVSRFDPSNVAFLFFIENVGDAEVDGLDVDFQWAATDNLTVMGAFSWLDTEVTRLNPQLDGIAVPVGSELPLAANISGNIRARYDFVMDSLQADGYVSASLNYRGETVSALIGSAEFFEDTLFQQTGLTSGLKLRNEGGTFGTVQIPDGAGGFRLPNNARYVNPTATTINAAIGFNKDEWGTELFIDNLTNEEAPIVQVAGKFTPEVSVQRPMTIGLRFNFNYE
jgi:outer membrane receptor protein involved in Fe transport